METAAEVQAEVLRKAKEDPEFYSRLLADPKAAIEETIELELPDDMLVFVQEALATANGPKSYADAPLSQDELVEVMGGRGCREAVWVMDWCPVDKRTGTGW